MVLSPQMLWSDYNRFYLPLDSVIITDKQNDFGVENHVYFNGEATSAGCTRVYARYYVPEKKTDKLVLIMHEPDTDISAVDLSSYYNPETAILIVDYAGNIQDRMRFTIYPHDLSFANYDKSSLYKTSESPQKTCHYIWTTVCLRAITFAQNEGYTKIATIGIGIGGASVMRSSAICDYPLCAASFFSPGFFPQGEDPELMAMTVSLNVTGYSQILKVPFLHQCCSNDSDSSLDAISELSDKSMENDILYISKRSENPCKKDILNIVPRASKEFTAQMKNNLNKYVTAYFNSDFPCEITDGLAPDISFTVTGAEDKMYFSVKCDTVLKSITLYVSHGIENAAYRNWRTVTLEKAGENEFIGYTEVYSANKPIYSFVSVVTNDDFVYSTQIVKKLPSSLKIHPTSIVKRRLIYDSDMGINDFFSSDKNYSPFIKEGPYSISGICASKGLCTYKLGDVAYSGESDNNLQLLMFSPVPQQVKFSVTDSEQFITFTCVKNISPDTDWTKILISPSDLRSSEGSFGGWDKAIFLRIDAEEEIIISSMLWV